jgi:hypothetical protein
MGILGFMICIDIILILKDRISCNFKRDVN